MSMLYIYIYIYICISKDFNHSFKDFSIFSIYVYINIISPCFISCLIMCVIYCDEACIKGKSDILSTFTFSYRAVQKVCLLTEGLRRKRENLSFYFWSYVIEEFHSRGITCYDYITMCNPQ